MTNRTLILCDDAPRPALSEDDLEILSVNQHGSAQNLRLEIDNVSHALLHNISNETRDLLDVAAYVYYVDGSIKRGTNKDVFGKRWRRDLTLSIPLRKPELWETPSTKGLLSELMEFLTEDKFEFVFSEREPWPEQLLLRNLKDQVPYGSGADSVLLFSGGMDSLAGAANLYATGKRPILCSHQSNAVLANRQRAIAAELRTRLPSWQFPHLDVKINRKGNIASEDSQRSRSFLFLAFGSLVAYELGIKELVVAENGITTFNLPRLGQTLGTMASRSTHPRVIELFRELANQILQTELVISTPFLWKTRAEVLGLLEDNDLEDLLPLSASCNHSRRPKVYPHCGTCSQCVDRRFALVTTGLDRLEDEVMGYEKNIFLDALDEGEEIMQAMSPVQFSLDIQRRDPFSFVTRYGEVYDAIESIPGDTEQNLKEIYDLHLRYANEVHEAMSLEHSKHWDQLYRRDLPATCLLTLTGASAPRRPDCDVIEQTEELIQDLIACPATLARPYEEICERILTFLFCQDLPTSQALSHPNSQSPTDQGYKRRDLVYKNRATEGFWFLVRSKYGAEAVIVDAKNYTSELDSDTVLGFATKYLEDYKLGRFGILVARKLPADARDSVGTQERLSGAVDAQKTAWRDHHKMVVLLDDNDLIEMLNKKSKGEDPTTLVDERIYTLRSRM